MNMKKAFGTIPCLFFVTFLLAFAPEVPAECVYIVPPSGSMSKATLKYQSLAYHGSVISKPTCETRWTAQIFVRPNRVTGGSGGNYYPMTGFTSYAVDGGTSWTIISQVKNVEEPYSVLSQSWVIQSVVQVWCCANPSCT